MSGSAHSAAPLRLPQYLHRPLQILWFEADDLAAAGVGYLLGFLFGGWLWLAIPVLPVVYRRAKRGRPRGYLRHLLWAAGWARLSGYPTYFEDRFDE